MTKILAWAKLVIAIVGLVLGARVAFNFAPASAQILLADARSDAARLLFAEAVDLHGQRNFAGAVEKFELGLRINSDDPVAHYYMAESLKALGKESDAMQHYEAAARLGPNTKEGIVAAAIVSRRNEALLAAENAKKQAAQAAENARRAAETAEFEGKKAALKEAGKVISVGAYLTTRMTYYVEKSPGYCKGSVTSLTSPGSERVLPEFTTGDGRIIVNNKTMPLIDTLEDWGNVPQTARFDASGLTWEAIRGSINDGEIKFGIYAKNRDYFHLTIFSGRKSFIAGIQRAGEYRQGETTCGTIFFQGLIEQKP